MGHWIGGARHPCLPSAERLEAGLACEEHAVAEFPTVCALNWYRKQRHPSDAVRYLPRRRPGAFWHFWCWCPDVSFHAVLRKRSAYSGSISLRPCLN
jgi:hypothetical protein